MAEWVKRVKLSELALPRSMHGMIESGAVYRVCRERHGGNEMQSPTGHLTNLSR